MRIPTLLAVLATTALLAGCTGTTGGTATSTPTGTTGGPSTSASSGTGGDTTANGAPKVKTPLDFAKAAASPCGLLSAAQLQTLGMAGAAGKPGSGAAGPSCGWNDASGASGQSITFTFVAGGGGLDGLYASKDSSALFEPQPLLQGYPTLLNGPTDDRSRGACPLVVGLTDGQILTASVQMRSGSNAAPRYAEPCVVAKEAADLALTSIKGGS